MGVVYGLNFPPSENWYIGSTKNVGKRERRHRWLLDRGTHHCRALQNAASKYGLQNMVVEVFQADVPADWLIAREQHWLDHFSGRLYNRLLVAAPRPHANTSDLTREKQRKHLLGNQHRKGVPHTLADKMKISEGLKRSYAIKGRKQPNLTSRNAYIRKIRAGEIDSPYRRRPHEILRALSELARHRSFAAAGASLAMTAENIRHICRDARESLLAMGEFVAAPRHARGQFIHPDWFDLLECSNAIPLR